MCPCTCTCMCVYLADTVGDPMVCPPPQSVDDLEDLTGEPMEVSSPAAANSTSFHASSADKAKVHCTFPSQVSF